MSGISVAVDSLLLLCVGWLERMHAGDFDEEMLAYNAPEPPEID